MESETPFEKTSRLGPTWSHDAAGYVKDTPEWVARCLARVQALDPILDTQAAETTVRELCALERWRVMAPEAAADQLYVKVAPRPRT